MKNFVKLFGALIVIVMMSALTASASEVVVTSEDESESTQVRKPASQVYPWQPSKISRRADKSWFDNKPNSAKNFSRRELSHRHYKKMAKKARRNAQGHYKIAQVKKW